MDQAQVEADFTQERDTKRMVRCQEVLGPDDEIIGTLYISKRALAKIGNPRQVTVTIRPSKNLATTPASGK